jgi:hypothetical protein
MRMHLVVAVGIILSTAAGAWSQVSITACGQTVGAGESGVLDADLTCPTGEGTFVVAIENGGSLDLAGHTLAGGRTGIRCTKRCTIGSTGTPGTIQDTEFGVGAGIAAVTDGGRLTLSNLILDNHSIALLTDFDTGKVYGTDVTLTDNGLGMQARKIRITGLTASGNYTVAQSRKTTIEDSTVTASGDSAFTGRVVVLMNSSVTGSGSGIDLLTQRRPRVVSSTCEVSRILQNPTETWGVCTND